MKKLVVVFIFLILLVHKTVCEDTPVAVVCKFKGKPVIIRENKEVKIQQYMPIYVNDKVKTFSSSYVELVFDTGITLRIEENTVVEIKNVILELFDNKKKAVSTVISVETGNVLTDSTVMEDKYWLKSLYILTPTMVASVRGTVFYIKVYDDGSTTVAVFKGEVEGYIGSMDITEFDEMFKSEEVEYEKKKKVVIRQDEQALFSTDFTLPAVVELSFSMKEYKRTVVENFIKLAAEYRKNFDRFRQHRDEWIIQHKKQFIKEKDKMKQEFMKEFKFEKLDKKRR